MVNHPVLKPGYSLPELQRYIAETLKYRGLDGQSVQDEFIMLCEEVGELAKALRKVLGGKMAQDAAEIELEHEAADVLWMLLAVCNALHIDIEQALHAKDAKNRQRVWR